MRELLPNPMLASFVQFGGITPPALVFITQLDSLQDQGSCHHKPYVIHHLVFLLNPYHHQQLQLQVLEILGWLPRHVGLLSSIL
jgi:hypothetical protein